MNWLDLEGLEQTEITAQIGQIFKLHALLLEDVLNTEHRPKLEEFDEATLIIVKMLSYNQEEDDIVSEHISIVLAGNTLITFQQIAGDVFNPVRDRIIKAGGKVRKKKANYLLFCLLDAIVDQYMVIVESIAERLEYLEDEILSNPTENVIQRLHAYKRKMLQLRKAAAPLREVIAEILRGDGKLIDNETEIYYRDLYSNIIQIIEPIELQRDTRTGLQDPSLSSLSNRMNEVMKTLTILTTIFMPMTFLAGLWGMNFHFMPELEWRYGYPFAISLMFVAAISFVVYFRRKKWL